MVNEMISYDVNITIPDTHVSLEETRLWLKKLCEWGVENLENTSYWVNTSSMYENTKHLTNDTISITFLCTNEQDAISLKLGWT